MSVASGKTDGNFGRRKQVRGRFFIEWLVVLKEPLFVIGHSAALMNSNGGCNSGARGFTHLFKCH